MKKNAEELMEECLRKYREIELLTVSGWKDETGELLHRILVEECSRIEEYLRIDREQNND